MCVLVATGASCGRGFVVVGVTVLCLSEEKYLFLPVISTLFRDLETKYAARFVGVIASVILVRVLFRRSALYRLFLLRACSCMLCIAAICSSSGVVRVIVVL